MSAPGLRNSLGSRGHTLVEVLVTLALVVAAFLVALPPMRRAQDALAVDGAAAVTVRAMLDARHGAVRRSERVALHLDSTTAQLTLVATTDTLATFALGASFGVTLASSRDSIAWTPVGLGYGAANTRVVLQRGHAAETVTVSRLGRVRR
jgi:type II secretory pathway pseudopilin PulG